MPDRQAYRASVALRPRFRCLVCKRFVEGTDHGTCPSCGWQPPTVRDDRPRAAPQRTWTLGLFFVAAAMAIVYFTR